MFVHFPLLFLTFLPLFLACHTQLDALPPGLQPLPAGLTGTNAGLPTAISPDCAPALAGDVVLNEYLVRPAGIDVDGDGKSNGRDEALELALTTGSRQVHLQGAKFYVDGQLRGQIVGPVCLDPRHLVVLLSNTAALASWPPGVDEIRLDHLLKLPDGGASLELRTADDQLLFRHAYIPEQGGAPSSWTRTVDGDGSSDWQRALDWSEGHGRAQTIGACNDGRPACACLASQGMDCAADGG